MLIDIALLMLVFLLSIPAITGYFAHCYGRSFWRWFAAACFFPVLAQVALAVLCHRKAQLEMRRQSSFISRYEDEQMHQHINDVMSGISQRKNIS